VAFPADDGHSIAQDDVLPVVHPYAPGEWAVVLAAADTVGTQAFLSADFFEGFPR
jgi:hypothetical protein